MNQERSEQKIRTKIIFYNPVKWWLNKFSKKFVFVLRCTEFIDFTNSANIKYLKNCHIDIGLYLGIYDLTKTLIYFANI